jgi:nitroreductase
MFNDRSTPLALLHTRRSGKPRDMIAPGPDDTQLRAILQAAIRVPDHGKLSPWRIVIVAADQRDRLALILVAARRAEKPDVSEAELAGLVQFAHQAPVLVIVLSAPVAGSKIPLWEQELSAGALCMAMLTAASALGFVGGWLTGWPAYSGAVRAAFGTDAMRIAGFIFMGSPARALEERPRPDYDIIVNNWR